MEYIKGHWGSPRRKRTSADSCGPGGEDTQERGQIRIWAAPSAGSETSRVLGILGRRGGLWLPARERTLTAVTQEKHLLFLCCNLFCVLFFFFPSLCCSCQFYSHCEIWLSLWAFFPQKHYFLLLLQTSGSTLGFSVLWSFYLFFFFFLSLSFSFFYFIFFNFNF